MLRFCGLMMICLTLFSCVNFEKINYEKDVGNVDRSMSIFVNDFNQRNFAEIYKRADEKAKASKTQEALVAFLGDLNSRFGQIQNFERIETEIENKSSYRSITAYYKIQFAKGSTGLKTVWNVSNDKASLFSISEIVITTSANE